MPYVMQAPDYCPDGTVEHSYKESVVVKDRKIECKYIETVRFLEKFGYRLIEEEKKRWRIRRSKS